ncbi:uncharacterized protein EV420DRAFT_1104718 [Desarmillaria tabescens]|uniref:Uncharacterized protein n=1 Tax=Armillaria tabescens TaxID=1929756 RepID=A0AA39TR73_ARMTA|nr:uncharacterized protein EV420DRAFT_1104718 [Desarmillaria tabescens]KAK0463723.1 hypothetical protein EV420DRAFT_1104718 [Desarmillaria tabescens]
MILVAILLPNRSFAFGIVQEYQLPEKLLRINKWDRDWTIFPHFCLFVLVLLPLRRWYKYAQFRRTRLSFTSQPLLRLNMAVHDMRYQLAPPLDHYFTFSVDVAATLELYCDGGDEFMLRMLEGMQDRRYAGHCLEVERPKLSGETPKYKAIEIRPVQQGLTKPHPRKPDYARPTMCVPILPTTAHPKSREPLQVSKPLLWDNCYHPTYYDLWARVPSEWRDYQDSPSVNFSVALFKALKEDERYGQLLRAGLDDAEIQANSRWSRRRPRLGRRFGD